MPFDNSDYQPIETKPEVFSLEGLIAWLETQDPATEYNWGCGGECLYGLYGQVMGLTGPGPDGWNGPSAPYLRVVRGLRQHYGLPNNIYEPFDIAMRGPWTFGAALDRVRTLVASRAGGR